MAGRSSSGHIRPSVPLDEVPESGVRGKVVQKIIGKLVDTLGHDFYFASRHWAVNKNRSPLTVLKLQWGDGFFVVCWHQDQESNWAEYFGAHVAQLVEHVLGKDEVISSSLIMGSMPDETPVETNRTTQPGNSTWLKSNFKERNPI